MLLYDVVDAIKLRHVESFDSTSPASVVECSSIAVAA
jgi:hypothetical protein